MNHVEQDPTGHRTLVRLLTLAAATDCHGSVRSLTSLWSDPEWLGSGRVSVQPVHAADGYELAHELLIPADLVVVIAHGRLVGGDYRLSADPAGTDPRHELSLTALTAYGRLDTAALLVDAAGSGQARPLLRAVLAHPDTLLITTPPDLAVDDGATGGHRHSPCLAHALVTAQLNRLDPDRPPTPEQLTQAWQQTVAAQALNPAHHGAPLRLQAHAAQPHPAAA